MSSLFTRRYKPVAKAVQESSPSSGSASNSIDDDDDDPTVMSGEQQQQQQNTHPSQSPPSSLITELSRLQATPSAAALEEDSKPHNVPLPLRQAQLLLYVSHAFSQFAEGAWQFAVILFLSAITQYTSMVLVSTYYLTTYAAVCAFGAPLGRFVDQAHRLTAARFCILVQNVSVLVATIACCWLLTQYQNKEDATATATTTSTSNTEQEDGHGVPHDALSIVLLVIVHVFGSVAQVLDQAFVVAMERDWIVVMSREMSLGSGRNTTMDTTMATDTDMDTDTATDDKVAETWLSRTNVALRQIDLACKVTAPAVAGLVVGQAGNGLSSSTDDATTGGWCDLHGAAVLVGCVNMAALVVEYVCTAEIYNLIPSLSVRMEVSAPINGTHHNSNREEEVGEADSSASETATEGSSLWRGLVVYIEQSIVWAGLCLTAIYLNSMSFGGFMTAYLLWKKMSVAEVGLWRSIASVTGLLGTFAYQLSTRYTTVVTTGQMSTIYLFGCLSLALGSFLIADDTLSTYLLVVSCAASRIGLWTLDITITLLYQEFVPNGVRGLVGGTQQALNSFCVVLTGCLGLVFQRPEQFYVFAAVSYFGITLGMVFFNFGVYQRQHLFQMAIDR